MLLLLRKISRKFLVVFVGDIEMGNTF